jgi:hypothetical protein
MYDHLGSLGKINSLFCSLANRKILHNHLSFKLIEIYTWTSQTFIFLRIEEHLIYANFTFNLTVSIHLASNALALIQPLKLFYFTNWILKSPASLSIFYCNLTFPHYQSFSWIVLRWIESLENVWKRYLMIVKLCHLVSTGWKYLGVSVKMYMQLVTIGLYLMKLAKSLSYGLFPVNVNCPYTSIATKSILSPWITISRVTENILKTTNECECLFA